MALWGNKDDYYSAGTVSVKLAGINTYYADGILVEKSSGINQTDSDTTPPYSGQVVYEVLGSIGAGAGTSFGKGVGFAKTGDILKFGDIVGGTYYGNGIVVGIASTTLCYIASTEGFPADVTDVTLASSDYTVNEQTTYTSEQGRWSQQNRSSAETSVMGFVGLAYSVSVAAAATTLWVLDDSYDTMDRENEKPIVQAGDSFSTSQTDGSWVGLVDLTSGTQDDVMVNIWTTTLTATTASGVATVSVADTSQFQIGDTVTSPSDGSAGPVVVNRIGLSTIGFTGNLTAQWTSGNRVSIGRTVDNVVTVGSANVSVAQSATVRVTRTTGRQAFYLAGVSTTGAGSATSTAYEVAHGGWVGVTTYHDSEGNLRVKSETLVAMSGIATGNNPVWGAKPSVS